MTYEFLEHTADVGIKVESSTIEQAFQDAGKALFQTMTDIGKVQTIEQTHFKVEASSIQDLLIEYLNHLLSLVDIEDSFYSDFEIEINKNEKYQLDCTAYGEKINQEKHELKTEVKAATYYGLSYKKDKNHEFTFVLDV